MRRFAVPLFGVLATAALVAVSPSGCSGGSESVTEQPDAICTSDPSEWHGLLGSPCAPASPCPGPLECFYEPGCASPHGHCERWALCPDVEVLYYYCGCDGVDLEQSTAPYAHEGHCSSGDSGPDVAPADTR